MSPIIAIDPGFNGAVVLRDANWQGSLNTKFHRHSERGIAIHDLADTIVGMIAMVGNSASDIVFIIEDVHAIFGSAAKATFNFGFVAGQLNALVHTIQPDPKKIIYVQPKVWQKEIWLPEDIVLKPGKKRPTKDTKKTSLNAYQRITGDLNERHDGIIDAYLISQYARNIGL